MLLFLDTADLDEIKKYAFMIHGVTTTPTIIKRDFGGSDDEFMSKVRKQHPTLEIHVEALAHDSDATVSLIRDNFVRKNWYDAEKVVFKVPISLDGLKATRHLAEVAPSVKVNLHMVFASSQAVLAMHSDPAYIAPLIGRYADKIAEISDHGFRSKTNDAGLRMLASIIECKTSMSSNTHVLASSIRSTHDFAHAIAAGADAITLPPSILAKALKHPMTTEGVDIFLKDLV